MAVDDVYQLHLNQRYAAQQLQTVLAFRMKTAADPSPAVAAALAAAWAAHFGVMQVVALTYVSWILQQVRGGTVSYTTKPCLRDGGLRLEGSLSVAGTASGDGLPPQSSVVTTLSTGFSGRRRRGRNYMAGLSETYQIAGTIDSSFVSTAQGYWNTRLSQFGPSGTDPNFQLGVWSQTEATGCTPSKSPPYKLSQTEPSDPAAAFLNVTSAAVRNIVYSQRRRTIGVGR